MQLDWLNRITLHQSPITNHQSPITDHEASPPRFQPEISSRLTAAAVHGTERAEQQQAERSRLGHGGSACEARAFFVAAE